MKILILTFILSASNVFAQYGNTPGQGYGMTGGGAGASGPNYGSVNAGIGMGMGSGTTGSPGNSQGTPMNQTGLGPCQVACVPSLASGSGLPQARLQAGTSLTSGLSLAQCLTKKISVEAEAIEKLCGSERGTFNVSCSITHKSNVVSFPVIKVSCSRN